MSVISQPLIVVRDVEAASRWYCQLLGATSGHGGPEYERVMVGDEFIMQLHAWDVHDHQHLGDPALPVGNGAVLWFKVADFDGTVARAREHSARPYSRRCTRIPARTTSRSGFAIQMVTSSSSRRRRPDAGCSGGVRPRGPSLQALIE